MNEPEDNSALSKDKGEKWGRLYEESYLEAWRATTAYGTGSIEPQPQLQLSEARKLAALRFRAECVAPYEQLREAAETWLNTRKVHRSPGGPEATRDFVNACEALEGATKALSVPAPAAPDEPPNAEKQEGAIDDCPLCLIGKKGASGFCAGCYEKVWLVKCQKCGWDCHLADYGYECNKVGDIISIVCPDCKTAWWKIVGESFGVAAIRAKLEGK